MQHQQQPSTLDSQTSLSVRETVLQGEEQVALFLHRYFTPFLCRFEEGVPLTPTPCSTITVDRNLAVGQMVVLLMVRAFCTPDGSRYYSIIWVDCTTECVDTVQDGPKGRPQSLPLSVLSSKRWTTIVEPKTLMQWLEQYPDSLPNPTWCTDLTTTWMSGSSHYLPHTLDGRPISDPEVSTSLLPALLEFATSFLEEVRELRRMHRFRKELSLGNSHAEESAQRMQREHLRLMEDMHLNDLRLHAFARALKELRVRLGEKGTLTDLTPTTVAELKRTLPAKRISARKVDVLLSACASTHQSQSRKRGASQVTADPSGPSKRGKVDATTASLATTKPADAVIKFMANLRSRSADLHAESDKLFLQLNSALGRLKGQRSRYATDSAEAQVLEAKVGRWRESAAGWSSCVMKMHVPASTIPVVLTANDALYRSFKEAVGVPRPSECRELPTTTVGWVRGSKTCSI